MSTLLMTGAIQIEALSVPNTVISDTNIRLKQYLEAIRYAIMSYKCIDKIVFCENTNYRFETSELIRLATEHHKQIEFLSFQGDYHTIQNLGKGYGEGEIIDFALNNSTLLKDAVEFYKLTGRLRIRNFDQLHASSSGNKNCFIYHSESHFNISRDHFETYFFKCEKSLYNICLRNCYVQVNEKNRVYLEHLFADRLRPLSIRSFSRLPLIEGISGSSGTPYLGSRKEMIWSEIYDFAGVHHRTKTRIEIIMSSCLRFLFRLKQSIKHDCQS